MGDTLEALGFFYESMKDSFKRGTRYKLRVPEELTERFLDHHTSNRMKFSWVTWSPEVHAWCEIHLRKPPMVFPHTLDRMIRPPHRHLYFDNKNDAFAFKMRWL